MSHIVLLSWGTCISIKREDLTWHWWFLWEKKNERKGFFPRRKNTINTSTLLTGVRKSKQNENMFFFPRISERRVINILELMAQRRGFEGLLMLEQVIAIQSPWMHGKKIAVISFKCVESSSGNLTEPFTLGWKSPAPAKTLPVHCMESTSCASVQFWTT